MTVLSALLDAARLHPLSPYNAGQKSKPWDIPKSKYRFVPWYTGLKVVV